MQLSDWRPIRKESKWAFSDLGRSRRHFHFVVGLQLVLGILDEFQRVRRRQRRKEHILSSDQDSPASRSFERAVRADLSHHIATTVRRTGPFVFLLPIRRY